MEQFDKEKIYDYSEYPDKNAGRCDHCNNSHFENSIKNGKLFRKCRQCGMTKSI
ncbi:hypothetical protein [Niallia circulans]|uniref:hypothetical protein n=1 Tax=Niallia circulans TaxID=1397 RepID=UPI0026EF9B7F|nr:hypothetical protein [Niallia circulans]